MYYWIPKSKPLERNVVYITITTSGHAMPRTFKYTMSPYNLIGRWRYSVVIEAIPQLAEKLHVIVFMLQFQCLYTIFRQSFDKNECKYKPWIPLSDVYCIVNYFGSLAKFRWSPSGSLALHATQCSLHFTLVARKVQMNPFGGSFTLHATQCSLHFALVARKLWTSPIGVHSICTRTNVVKTSINLRAQLFRASLA